MAFVDEAQNIPVRESTKATIDRLHRGTDGIALLPIFFGLGNTERILGECGISRPGSGRLWELRPMGEDETAESLAAVFDAYGFGLPGPERDRWISELAKKSQGWPQHLNRVAVAAGKAIQESGFDLRRASLAEAVLAGRLLKDEYYEMLLGRGADCPDLYKGLALAAALGSGVLSRGEIERLASPTLKRIGLDVDSFLDNSLHAGLLSPTTSGRYEYRFPIPSLAQFLRQLPVDPARHSCLNPPEFRNVANPFTWSPRRLRCLSIWAWSRRASAWMTLTPRGFLCQPPIDPSGNSETS